MSIPEEERLIAISANQKKIQLIKEMVCAYYKRPMSDYESRSRNKEIIHLKYVAIWMSMKLTKSTKIDVARAFGYNHATALHAENQIEKYMTLFTEKKLQHEVNEIKALTEMRILAVDEKINLGDGYNYINLNTCSGIKDGEEKAIIFSGYFTEEIDDMLSALKSAGIITGGNPLIKFENTGMHLIKKIGKNGK